MDREQLIYQFWELFSSIRVKASLYYELPKAEAKELVNKLQNQLQLIHENLEVSIHSDGENIAHILTIHDDATPDVINIADEVLEKAPKFDNWEIWQETKNLSGYGPIMEYDPIGSESNPDPYLDNVYLSIIPVIPRTEEPMLNLYIYMNEVDAEFLQHQIRFLLPALLGMTRYTEWVQSLTFLDKNEIVPNDAIPFVRSDLWIEFMENCIKR